MIIRSKAPLTDALDYAVNTDWDFSRTLAGSSSDPLCHYLTDEDVDELLSQQTAWSHVKRVEHHDET